jgi:hypothetical protein
MPTPPSPPRLDGVMLRMACAGDAADLIRLTELDGARPLPGPAFVAEEKGAIVAALCLSTGRAVADPFVSSLHLVELLRRHAVCRQVLRVAPRRRRLPLRPAFRTS